MKALVLGFALMFAAPAFAHESHDDSAASGFTHLTFANGAVHAHCTWVQGPRSPDESVLQIRWMDGATHTSAEPPGTFTVSLFMPEMGHGSAPTQLQRVLDASGNPLPADYNVSAMYFTMPGKWQVNVTLNYANGSKETQTITVDVPAAAGSGGMHHH